MTELKQAGELNQSNLARVHNKRFYAIWAGHCNIGNNPLLCFSPGLTSSKSPQLLATLLVLRLAL